VHLAAQPESERGIAHQQQECQKSLLDQRKPLIAGQPASCVAGQRPRQKEVENGHQKLPVGAQPAAGFRGAHAGLADEGISPKAAPSAAGDVPVDFA
jgi:hypothetical protein